MDPLCQLRSEDERPLEQQQGEHHVPVIDLHGLWQVEEETEAKIIQELGWACQNYGFFRVVNHGISPEFMENMELQGRRLFSMPLEQKLKAQGGPIGSYGVPGISTLFKTQTCRESLTCLGSPEDYAKKLWPQDHQQFCEVEAEFERVMKDLAIKLMSLIGKGLGLNAREIINCEEMGWDDTFGTVQLNYYYSQASSDQPQGTMGMAPHTDPPFLTFLYQGAVEGLQYQHNGNWIVAPALPNALVVHVCDMLQILSNGRYKSALHRAIQNQSRSRLSAVYLWGPPATAVIKPAAKLVDSEHPPLYKSVPKKDFLRAKAVHGIDALQLFKYEDIPHDS